MKHLFVILAACVLFFEPALASKEVGGGSGTSGRILDRVLSEKSTKLDGEALLKSLVKRFGKEFSEYPFLFAMSEHYLIGNNSKAWSLDDLPFVDDCKNKSSVKVTLEDWACQDRTTVRIRAAVWKKLNEATRADLVFHEILTAARLLDPRIETTFEVVAPSFATIVDRRLSFLDKRTELTRLGFGVLYHAEEVEIARKTLIRYESAVCLSRLQSGIMRLSNAATMREAELASLTFLLTEAGVNLAPEVALLIKAAADIAFAEIKSNTICENVMRNTPSILWRAWMNQNLVRSLK